MHVGAGGDEQHARLRQALINASVFGVAIAALFFGYVCCKLDEIADLMRRRGCRHCPDVT
jgi:hypothetical protein